MKILTPRSCRAGTHVPKSHLVSVSEFVRFICGLGGYGVGESDESDVTASDEEEELSLIHI